MKTPNSSINLIGIALKTSFVLGILFAIIPFRHMPFYLGVLLFRGVFATLLSLFIWAINIWIVSVFKKNNLQHLARKIKYLIGYAIIICLTTIIFVSVKQYVNLFPEYIKQVLLISPEYDIYRFLFFVSMLNAICIAIQESVFSRDNRIKIELENEQLKTKNSEAMYQQLKQQIHPHFLFNSLNVLKVLIKKNPELAVDYTIKLSDFLRTSISSTNSNTVKLADELKMCLDYLEMQKMRFGNALEFTINIPKEIESTGFVPLFSIQLLLENAIKHNLLTDELPLKIKVIYEDNRITVYNNIQKKLSTEICTGLGINNLSERYKILSGNDINIKASEDSFSVSIKILPQ